MKILQLNKFYYHKGGAERYLLELSDLLTRHGHEVIPFAMADARNIETPYSKFFVSPVETREVKGGVIGLKTLGRMIYSFEAARKLRALLKTTRPDVAHVHNIYTQISPSVLDVLKSEGIPIVHTIHDYDLIAPNYMLWHNGRIENLSRKSLLNLTLSKFHKDSRRASFAQALAFKLHHWRQSYKRTVNRFLPSSDFVWNEHTARGFPRGHASILPLFTDAVNQAPRFDDDGYVLYVGRLVPEKGVEVLLRAMQELPNVPCKIVGTGPEEIQLHIMGDRMPNVTFEGYQSGSTLWDLMRGARAIVVPSLWQEVFGLVAIEAMALGKPVIASDVGALSEIVADRVSGLLVPPGSVPALKGAIARVAEDPIFATQLGRAGRQRAEQKYSPEGHYQKLINIYQEVIESVSGKRG
ncbi:MAG: glycosyltransferase [Patescibacteria group bacterium]